jgi:glycosyltransferase involved in cell wall biosynthesis
LNVFVLESDLPDVVPGHPNGGAQLDAGTSVRHLKKHFFATLGELGSIRHLDPQLSCSALTKLFNLPDSIFVHVNSTEKRPYLNEIEKRTLQHSLGEMLLPNPFFRGAAYRLNTVHLLTTMFQKERIEKHLGNAAPAMAIFPPALDESRFYRPTASEKAAAREKFGLSAEHIHIVFAGRLLATKGFCQLLRALSLWPMKNAKMSVVGSYQPESPIQQLGVSHEMFEHYVQEQIMTRYGENDCHFLDALDKDKLRTLYWSADSFVYPSVHSDENFGYAPREAGLCGLPVVVTDFGGLAPLAQRNPWKGIATYPTLNGCRYSLKQLRDLISLSLNAEEGHTEDQIRQIRAECDLRTSKKNLQAAIKKLCAERLQPPWSQEEESSHAFNQLLKEADEKIVRAMLYQETICPEGLFAGTVNVNTLRHAYLSAAILGMYTTMATPPRVKQHGQYRGFFPLEIHNEDRTLVEFGFPGPRVKRYPEKEWALLLSCLLREEGSSEITFMAHGEDTFPVLQELVHFGYLVPDAIDPHEASADILYERAADQ